MVLLIIEYCNVIYDNCSLKDSIAIENIQRRAASICTGAYRHTSNDSLMAELGWQPLSIRRLIHKLSLLFKITNSLTPPYLRRIIPRSTDSQYELRSRSNASLPVPYSRLSSTRNAFIHSTIKSWNSLPENLRSCNSLVHFTHGLCSKLHKTYNAKSLSNLYLFVPPCKSSTQHCRLRLGLSALNFHLFTYNLVDDK